MPGERAATLRGLKPGTTLAWASAEISPGGQRRNFAYHFEDADDAM